MQGAIVTMRAEHRSLAAVLDALVHVAGDLLKPGNKADIPTLSALLQYIDSYPNQFHHPKEDNYLFRLLRVRAPDAQNLLLALEAEHRMNTELMAGLYQSFAVLADSPGDRSVAGRFERLAGEYARFHWSHMRLEEEQIFPLAEQKLLPIDWLEIDAAFADNRDPLFGMAAKSHYADLVRRIVNRVPEPIGLGLRNPPPTR